MNEEHPGKRVEWQQRTYHLSYSAGLHFDAWMLFVENMKKVGCGFLGVSD